MQNHQRQADSRAIKAHLAQRFNEMAKRGITPEVLQKAAVESLRAMVVTIAGAVTDADLDRVVITAVIDDAGNGSITYAVPPDLRERLCHFLPFSIADEPMQ